MNDNKIQAIRASAVLTDAYVAGNLIENADNFSDLTILANFTKGSLTDALIKVEFGNTLYYSLAYDGQSANFTVGKTVTGAQSGAKAIIIADTDAGATGTLTIKKINNVDFLDNEAITDDNGTPGVAVVNGTASVSSYTFYQEVETAKSSGVATETLATHKIAASGRFAIPIALKGYRYIRISVIGTGTVDGSLLSIDALLSGETEIN